MGAPPSSSAMFNRYRIGESTHHFHDDKVEAVAKSAQTSFFREDPFVLGISKHEEERGKRKKNKKNKKTRARTRRRLQSRKMGAWLYLPQILWTKTTKTKATMTLATLAT